MTIVTGHVVFEAGTPKFDSAILTVRLQDVGLIDGPTTVLAEYSTKISYTGKGQKYEFELDLPDNDPSIDPRSSYVVSAHVSLHDDDPTDIKVGDFLTMQSYPVLTQGYANTVDVEVKRVG